MELGDRLNLAAGDLLPHGDTGLGEFVEGGTLLVTQARKAPPITVEQYEGFEGYSGLRDELIYGEIVMAPRAKPWHQQLAQNLQDLLRDLLPANYVANQNANIRFALAHSMPSPDVFVVTREQWRRACERDEYLSAPPLLVVEVISPSNRKARVEQKIGLYLDHGVARVWEIHPKTRVVRVHSRGVLPESLTEAGTLVLPAPVDGSIVIGEIFRIP